MREQATDPFCRAEKGETGTRTARFTVREDGVLVRIAPLHGSSQIVVPEALRRRVLQLNNEPAASGHAGGQRMYETLRRGFYWPSMVADVYYTVRQCSSCARDRITLQQRTTPLTLFPARAPLESVALDLLGPLPKSLKGHLYILWS